MGEQCVRVRELREDRQTCGKAVAEFPDTLSLRLPSAMEPRYVLDASLCQQYCAALHGGKLRDEEALGRCDPATCTRASGSMAWHTRHLRTSSCILPSGGGKYV